MCEAELYRIVRHAVFREGLSQREAAARTRSRMDAHAVFVAAILAADEQAPKKQRHTIQRIDERLVE